MDREKNDGNGHEEHRNEERGFRESTPFLRSSFDSNHDSEHAAQPDPDSPEEKKARKFRTRVTILIALLIVAVDLPAVMFNTSMVRILESIYCREYYTIHDPSKFGANGRIEEQLCKIEDVQTQLSSLRGWMSFFSHLPGTTIQSRGVSVPPLTRCRTVPRHTFWNDCRQVWEEMALCHEHTFYARQDDLAVHCLYVLSIPETSATQANILEALILTLFL